MVCEKKIRDKTDRHEKYVKIRQKTLKIYTPGVPCKISKMTTFPVNTEVIIQNKRAAQTIITPTISNLDLNNDPTHF